MAAAAIFNQQGSAAHAATAAPMSSPASGNDSSSGSTGTSATITANDFLTLLVTEMKNQDPTANTDPNEYINQLVQVNSLEQLININGTLSSAFGTPVASTDGAASPEVSTAGQFANSGPIGATPSTRESSAAASLHSSGNLSIPAANASADRVAHALDGGARSGAALAGAR